MERVSEVLSPEDATSWQYPQDPQLSPAGDRVAFTLAEAARPDEHDRSAIWMVDLDGGEVRRFTFGERADSAPRWSPDGRQLAFLSDRQEAGKKQIYVMTATGGEAARLCAWKGGISSFQWSPDGRSIAFVGLDPKTDEEERREKERRDEVMRDQRLKYGRLYVVPAEGGDPARISREGETHVLALDWLPDSTGLIAVHVPSPSADDEGTGPTQFVRYGLGNDNEPQTLFVLNTGLEQPLVSPDGRWIAFRSKAGRVTVPDQVWLMPVTGGEPRLLTRSYQGTVDAIRWSPDSKEIRFVAYEDLWGALRAVEVKTGELRFLLLETDRRQGSYDAYLTQDASGEQIAVVRHASTRPPDVWVGRRGDALRPVTELNRRLASFGYSSSVPIHWTSDGVEIHGLLHRPLGYRSDRTYPLVVHVHGGPAWLWSDRFMADWHDWAQLLAQRGYAVLLPNPRGSTGRGSDFTDANVNDLGGGEFRDVMAGVDRAVELGIADPERLGIGGWSWGGYMTAWAVTQTNRFKCAVMGAGLSNLASDQGQNDVPRSNDDYYDVSAYEDAGPYLQVSAVTHMKRARTPTLILHGEKDERVAVPQAWEMYRGLRWAGVETELVTYPREGHGIKERGHQLDLLERVLNWYQRFLEP